MGVNYGQLCTFIVVEPTGIIHCFATIIQKDRCNFKYTGPFGFWLSDFSCPDNRPVRYFADWMSLIITALLLNDKSRFL